MPGFPQPRRKVPPTLPLGLLSCKYGGAVGVTFPEWAADSRGERSSTPSAAMIAALPERAGPGAAQWCWRWKPALPPPGGPGCVTRREAGDGGGEAWGGAGRGEEERAKPEQGERRGGSLAGREKRNKLGWMGHCGGRGGARQPRGGAMGRGRVCKSLL